MSKKTENCIVIILMIAIVIGLLCFVGYYNIKDWLSTPFVWKEPDFLSIEYVSTWEEGNDKYVLLEAYNSSEHEIDSYTFQVVTDNEVVKLNSLNGSTFSASGNLMYSGNIKANGFTTLAFRCSEYNLLGEETYDLFKNMNSSDIKDLEYRVVELGSLSDTLFSNNGRIKIITILVAALVLGLLGLIRKFPVWVRIALKVCSLPLALCFVVLLLFTWGKSQPRESQSDKDDSRYRSAKQRYDRAATLKAGAVSTGNRHSAAKAQEQMDKAMADMIMAKGSGSSSARDAAARYRREANLKAGATITGNAANAARAQANMDKAMADMIKNK